MNNTLIKGLTVLEALAHAQQPLGVTELAQQLGLAKSNVHRLLQALVELRYVRQLEAGGGYTASIRLWELGSAVLSQLDLRRIAQPFMEKLQESTRETVHLSVLDGTEVVYVHKIDSMQPVRAYSQIGGRAPAHCVATGKVLLSALDRDQLAQMARGGLRAATPKTITEPVQFMQEIERIRVQGYAVNRGEWRESVGGIAAPIRGSRGQVTAAVGISGPIERLKPTATRALAPQVVEAAMGISIELSGSPALTRLW